MHLDARYLLRCARMLTCVIRCSMIPLRPPPSPPRFQRDATDNCAAVCNGGNITGYAGNFWLDLDCDKLEFQFCCDPATYVQDAGTPSASSFLENLPAPTPAPTAVVDPDPYEKRRMCFSTDMPWHDAQAICESIGTHLITIHTEEELNHMGETVHFSRVPEAWNLDWRCFWLGLHDRDEENGFEWISGKRPAFSPPFGPFEAGNGDGAEEDCVALCQADCDHKPNATECKDLKEYGYTGDFLIDANCNDAYGFCCEGLAVDYVERAKANAPQSLADKKLAEAIAANQTARALEAAVEAKRVAEDATAEAAVEAASLERVYATQSSSFASAQAKIDSQSSTITALGIVTGIALVAAIGFGIALRSKESTGPRSGDVALQPYSTGSSA